MTRSEAAKICQSIKFILENSDYTEAVEEALNMAIEALEHEPTAEYSSDVISRKDAIDAFDGVKVDEKTEYDIGYNDGIDFAVSKLSVLPSAQPERPKGYWIKEENPNLGVCLKKIYICSNCNVAVGCQYFVRRSFCPSCGADMRGGPTLTPEEFAEKMAGIAENGDEERKHVAADSIMCELLKSLGFGEGVGIFEDMDKWYS